MKALMCAALLAVATAAPAQASVPEATLSCLYQINPKVHQISGTCTGSSDFGSATGSFTGSLRPHGVGHGSIDVETPAGEFSGSFRGNQFAVGKIEGTFDVAQDDLVMTGTFVAVLN